MNMIFEIPQPYEFKRHTDWLVDIGISAGCILVYVVAWIGLVCVLYLDHWIAGMLGALAGGLVGWIWFKMKRKYGQENNQPG
jgi:threonine/homoserine/homoserine lactone efflux protein